MRYGVLGDIHSNLSALRTVLDRMEKDGVDLILSVGDVIGYGAAPRQCIEILRGCGAVVVKGNHDAAAVGEIDLLYFNNYAREAVRWTQSVLTEDDIRWLSELPYVADLTHASVGHGTYHRPELFDYIQSTTDADPSLNAMPGKVCFVGHTHVPVTLLRLDEDPLLTAYTVEDEIDLGETSRALVNVGSVGQPRDEDCRAAYALYDTEREYIWIKRVDYDIEREVSRILSAGLPSVLAERLRLGI